jgi:hypothetical protein
VKHRQPVAHISDQSDRGNAAQGPLGVANEAVGANSGFTRPRLWVDAGELYRKNPAAPIQANFLT